MIRCLRSQLHRASRLRSFHCRRINSLETNLRYIFVTASRSGRMRQGANPVEPADPFV